MLLQNVFYESPSYRKMFFKIIFYIVNTLRSPVILYLKVLQTIFFKMFEKIINNIKKNILKIFRLYPWLSFKNNLNLDYELECPSKNVLKNRQLHRS